MSGLRLVANDITSSVFVLIRIFMLKIGGIKIALALYFFIGISSVLADEADLLDGTTTDTAILSEQENRPFLRFGRPLLPEKKSKFHKATENFPDVNSCIVVTDSSSSPAATTLAWEKFRSLEELDVCIFWVADTFRDIKMLRTWMTSNGYGGYLQRNTSESRMERLHSVGTGFYINGSIGRANIEANFGWLTMLGGYAISSSLTLDAEHRPVHVTSGILRK